MKSDEQIMSEMTQGAKAAVDQQALKLQMPENDELGQVVKELNLDAVENEGGFGDEAPLS